MVAKPELTVEMRRSGDQAGLSAKNISAAFSSPRRHDPMVLFSVTTIPFWLGIPVNRRLQPQAVLSTRHFSAAFPLHVIRGSWDHECFLARRQDRAFPLCTRFPVLLRTKDPPFDRFDRFSGEIRKAGQTFCFLRFVAGTNFRL